MATDMTASKKTDDSKGDNPPPSTDTFGMDKVLFLESLDFLCSVPTLSSSSSSSSSSASSPTVVFPTTPASETHNQEEEEEDDCDDETDGDLQLSKFLLSVEPKALATTYSDKPGSPSYPGVAFFCKQPLPRDDEQDEKKPPPSSASSTTINDPALMDVDLIVLTNANKATSISLRGVSGRITPRAAATPATATATTTTTTTTTPPPYNSASNKRNGINSVSPYRHSDHHDQHAPSVYLKINGRTYKVDISKLMNVTVDEPLNARGINSSPSTPPSLLLEFPSCRFRLFQLMNQTTTIVKRLHAIKRKLTKIIRAAATTAGTATSTATAQQATSPHINDLEHGQSVFHFQRDGNNNDTNNDIQEQQQQQSILDDCIKSHQMLHEHLETFHHLLTTTPSKTTTKEEITTIMNTITKNLASSYYYPHDHDNNENQTNQITNEIQMKIQNYFPKKKKMRLSQSQSQTNDDTMMVLQTMESLLKEYKSSIRKQYQQLYVLPRKSTF